jgi:hypothetical protein
VQVARLRPCNYPILVVGPEDGQGCCLVIGLRANVLASEAQVRPQAAWLMVVEAGGCCLVIGLRANVLASEAQVRAQAACSGCWWQPLHGLGFFECRSCCLVIGLRANVLASEAQVRAAAAWPGFVGAKGLLPGDWPARNRTSKRGTGEATGCMVSGFQRPAAAAW